MASPARLQKLLRSFSSRALDSVESIVYKQAKLRRPVTVDLWDPRRPPPNWCSFIGSVALSMRRFRKRYDGGDRCRAYTFLEVKRPTPSLDSDRPSSFQILLAMKDEVAERSLRYLRPNDVIYISGRLDSYEKVNEGGKRKIFYKVNVEELNYINCDDKNQACSPIHHHGSSRIEELRSPGSSAFDQEKACSSDSLDHERRSRDRLQLWQIFFTSPYEWWDNRKQKIHPGSPDFKHKDTKECLWIDSDDPPWVRKQLERYDLAMAADLTRRPGGRSNKHKWKLTDFE